MRSTPNPMLALKPPSFSHERLVAKLTLVKLVDNNLTLSLVVISAELSRLLEALIKRLLALKLDLTACAVPLSVWLS